MQRYVVIGNGVAAVGCIEGLRSVDGATPITVVSAEKHPVYCRPLISYYLEGKTDRQNAISPGGFLPKNGLRGVVRRIGSEDRSSSEDGRIEQR